MKKSKNNKRLHAVKISSGIDREIAKENGMLSVWRGRSAIHSSVKRTNRRIEKKNAIKDSSDK